MNSPRFSLARCLLAALSFGLCLGAAFAGDVIGNISEAAGQGPLPGAVVAVVGRAESTEADAGGNYVLKGLAAGTHQLQFRYLGYETKTLTVSVPATGDVTLNAQLGDQVVRLEAVKVEGYKEGRARALQQKQNQINISDIIASDAIGNLPDRNVAEAVSRLPGVNLSLEQGEGRYVSIRGVEPNLNQVMIDGAVAAAPGGTRLGRAVPLDTLGAGQVSQIEVVKSVTPDLDANSLGGTLKIRTASPFDRKGRFFNASASLNFDAQTERKNFDGRVSFSDLFGPGRKWGFGVTASFDQRDYSNHWVQSTWALRTINGTAIYLPNALEIKPEVGNTTRWGGNLALEYRPDKDTQFFVRPNFSRTERFERTYEILLNVDNSAARTTLTSPTTGTFAAAGYRPERRDFFSEREQELLSVSAGFKKVLGQLTLEPMVTYSNATEHKPIERSTQWRPAAGVSGPVNFALGGFEPARFDVDYALDTPANYTLRRTRHDTGIVEEDTYTAKTDVTWSLDEILHRPGSLKAGVKYTQRKRLTDLVSNRLVPVGNWRLSAIGVAPAVPVYDGKYTSGFLIDTDKTWNYLLANPALTTADVVDSAANSIEDDYDIAEYIYAGYLMSSVKFGRFTVLGGLRWEQTDARIRAVEARFNGSAFVGHFPTSGKTSYDKLFPNLQGVYRFTERIVARAAVTRTIGRPAYEDARPLSNFRRDPLGNAAIDPARFPFNGTLSIGNPNLRPYDAANYDVSLEWYARGAGLISVAAFRKDIKDPIYSYSEVQRNVVYSGTGLETLSLSGKINGDSGRISGLEFNLYHPFKYLPSPFDGLGIDANFTKISSDLKVPTRPLDDLPFFRQPSSIANVTLFYEKKRFSGRIAWSRSDEQLYTLGSNLLNDVYRRPRGQYDLQLRYKFSDRISANGAIRNLTREKEQFTYGVRQLMRTSRLLDREFKLGVEFNY